ncbi:flavin-containing monooxygenase [Dactylosporangium sucinum]|uniref:Oxidoreductase n=1 Tax=Dactylosporangium sucinum TaxID=1424081 RepID=A0A917U5L6_9ACTN|nr:NAD(P)/FAD-dependent oxidoreductase [Dactylosporangium sucinum]GGM55372.1 oxidoreductase [Dactylosporangium sucinum]
METLDTAIVGGGQAGLAVAYHLHRAGQAVAVLDAHARVGDAWRGRWDSLTLFTPNRYNGLPGLPFPGDPDAHPTKDDVAGYLEGYAARFGLPVHLGSPVTAVRPDPGGGFDVETPGQRYRARQVVVAAGAFHTPRVPEFAGRLSPCVVQLHSSRYRNPAQLPAGDVVVVGAGNTGVQIAEELAASGRRVALSVAELGPVLPQRWLGRDVFWWFSRLGTMGAGPDSLVGRRLRAQNPIIGTDVAALLRRVDRLDRAAGADGRDLLLAGGGRRTVDAVVWATGFRPHYPWLHVPVLDAGGAPVHREGVTGWPGLYFLGLPWQRARGSAVLGWVGRDAAVLARRLRSAAPAPARVA